MTDELAQYRAKSRDWLHRVERPVLATEYGERFRQLRDWQRTLHAGGWTGIHWPRAYGGQGLTVGHHLVFAEELVRAELPQPVGTIGLEIVGPTILRYGNEAQRRRFLPPLLSGDELWCQGFSEPDAGSDLASLRTQAVRDGNDLVVNGSKIWTSWATTADWCAVLARTDPHVPKHKGISYLIVELGKPGVSVKPIVQITGDPEFNELFFDDVRIPVENMVGEFGDGWKLAMDTLAHERAGYAIRRSLENELAFRALVNSLRNADDLPAEAPRLIGQLLVDLKTFEAQTRATAERLAAGDVPSPLDSVDKLTLTRTEQHLYAVGTEIVGAARMVAGAQPHGLDAETWTKGLLYARAASVYGGSEQIQLSIVAERLLGLPRER